MQSSHCGAYTIQILFIKIVNQVVKNSFILSAIKMTFKVMLLSYLILVTEFLKKQNSFLLIYYVYHLEQGRIDIFWSRVLDEDDL